MLLLGEDDFPSWPGCARHNAGAAQQRHLWIAPQGVELQAIVLHKAAIHSMCREPHTVSMLLEALAQCNERLQQTALLKAAFA